MTLPPGLQAIIDKHSRDRHPHGPKTTYWHSVVLELWGMIPSQPDVEPTPPGKCERIRSGCAFPNCGCFGVSR